MMIAYRTLINPQKEIKNSERAPCVTRKASSEQVRKQGN